MASSGALDAVAPPLSASTLSRHQSHESTNVSKNRTISLSLELAGASCQRKAEDLSHVSTASSLRILPAAYEQSVGTIDESSESEYERTMLPFASLATISIPSTRIVNEDEPSGTRSGYPTDFRKCSSLVLVIVALSTIGFSSIFSNLPILYHFSQYPSTPKPFWRVRESGLPTVRSQLTARRVSKIESDRHGFFAVDVDNNVVSGVNRLLAIGV